LKTIHSPSPPFAAAHDLLAGDLGLSDAGDLAVLTGAGTSMVGPTRLPSGPALLRSAIEMLIDDDRLLRLRERALEDPLFQSLVPETVLQRFRDILKSLPSEIYAPFRGASPNGVHLHLAELASHGAFIATANFDLAIERAAGLANIDLPAGTPLHLHGKASDPGSLVHTIRAVGRGLPPPIEAAFTNGLHNRRLVVLGYSGNDREIMDAIAAGGPRLVTWIVRDENDLALANLEIWKASIPPLRLFIGDLAELHTAKGIRPQPEHSSKASGEPQAPPHPLVQLELLIGLLLQLGRYSRAAEAAALGEGFTGSDDRHASIAALGCYASRRAGDLNAAVRSGKKALRLARHSDALPLRSRAHTELALVYLDLDPPETTRARRHLRAAWLLLKRAKQIEPSELVESLLASAEHNLGFVSESDYEYERALQHYLCALEMKKRLGDLPYQISSERDVALMLILLDREDEAAPHRQRFVDLCQTYSDAYELAYFDLALGRHRLHQGRAVDAREHLLLAEKKFEDLGDPASAGKARQGLEAIESKD
jgi:tetratricopeptide (TPR) repeat protein